jgi:hypothetical protein
MVTTERPLFGGAISCEIPTAWRDVSDIRQIPDHQECWQEMEGAVLVVEILQRQEVSDADAAAFFFNDLAESNGITSANDIRWETRPPPPRTSATTITAIETNTATTLCAGIGFQKVALGRDYDIEGNRRQNQEVRLIRVELCVFRLARVETDLLVTICKPVPNPNEPPPEDQPWSDTFQRVVSTLRIRDWGLFG